MMMATTSSFGKEMREALERWAEQGVALRAFGQLAHSRERASNWSESSVVVR